MPRLYAVGSLAVAWIGVALTVGCGGGDGGAATAGGDGGDGGKGGDSAIQVGAGGSAGTGATTEGAGGAGTAPGQPGTATPLDGAAGAAGNPIALRVLCIPFAFAAGLGAITPGTEFTAPVYDGAGGAQAGTIAVTFRDEAGAEYFEQSTPVQHIGYGPGSVDYDVSRLVLTDGSDPATVGVRLEPLTESTVDANHPITVQGLDSTGAVLDQASVSQIAAGSSDPNLGEPIEVQLDPGTGQFAAFRVSVPTGGFAMFWRICILDP